MMEIKQPMQCDVFVAGGGIAGLMAAIGAADAGAQVILAEKANTNRSGNGATGNDHFCCYLPEYHGDDMEAWIRALREFGNQADRNCVERFARESGQRVKDWNAWGIHMQPHGYWEFTGQTVPGKTHLYLKYEGLNQKPVLTREALKRGVTILNRHPFTEILKSPDGQICGAVCVDLTGPKPQIQVIRAKAVVLGTGATPRMFGSRYMGWMMNLQGCPASTGGGMAAAYRAGARLVSLEMYCAGVGVGQKYFNRGGKGTFVGVFTDIDGKPFTPFVTKPSIEYGESTLHFWKDMFQQMDKRGEPVFMNSTQCNQEELDYMTWGLTNEGNTCTLQHLKDENFDFRKHMIEFNLKVYGDVRGLWIDENGQTTVPGLYAAGNETGNCVAGIAGAATFGHIAGASAAAFSKDREFYGAEQTETVKQLHAHYSRLWEREADTDTPDWKEMNIALQQTMWDYCAGEKRNEKLLKVGLVHLGRLKEKVKQLHCGDAHTFMRCLEVENMYELAELVCLSALEHQESRGAHIRTDFPYTNPMFDHKRMAVEQKNGVPVFSWQEMIR